MSSTDPLLRGDTRRFVLFPIRYPTLWQRYKTALKCFWTTEEIDLSADRSDWIEHLTDAERHLLSAVLAFFACADGIVGENLVLQFYSEVQAPEVRCFYGFQVAMENVHAETYARLVQELVDDGAEVNRLFHAMDSIPSVKAKADWSMKWFDRSAYPFASRVIAFAIVEGVFFSSSFAAIMWVRSRGILPGLCHSNELIMRDEGLHVEFACELYHVLDAEVSVGVAHNMIREAVDLERAFFRAALPSALRGLNYPLMSQYVEYVADFLLGRLGFPALYDSANPFPFMESTAIPGRASFFERPVSDYLGAVVGRGLGSLNDSS